MGPPAFAGGNFDTGSISLIHLRVLQWGHRLSPVETWASTPRLPLRNRSFNGATGFRRWKHEGLGKRLPGQLCFNGATGFRRWKRANSARATVSEASRFNGATGFRRWKLPTRRKPPGQTRYRFNGATGFRRWKRRLIRAVRLGQCRFNGATGFRRWKPIPRAEARGPTTELQWGHRLSPVETRYSASASAKWANASMGPPAFAGGNSRP